MTRRVAALFVAGLLTLALMACDETPTIAASKERCYQQVDRYLTPKRIRENELWGIARIDALTKEVEIRKACEIYAGDDFSTVSDVADAVLSEVGTDLREQAMDN